MICLPEIWLVTAGKTYTTHTHTHIYIYIQHFEVLQFSLVISFFDRSAIGEFLLRNGQRETWLVGNKLITVTTSGGGLRDSGSIFCNKCLDLLQQSHHSKVGISIGVFKTVSVSLC